jgi:hypothetical protein
LLSSQELPRQAGSGGTPPGGTAADGTPSRRFSPVTVTAVVLGAAQLAWHGVVLLLGYFWQDDFVLMYRASTQPLGSYLVQNYNGHFMPGAFLLTKTLVELAPLNWPLAALTILAMQAAAVVLAWLALVRMFGRRRATLLPFGVLVFSPLIFISTAWYAFAIQLLPMMIALFGAVHAQVVYLQTGRRGWAAAGIAWTAFGLAFFEKSALIVAVVFAVTLLAAPERRIVAALGGVLRRQWAVWAGYLVLLAVYVPLYLHFAGRQPANTTHSRVSVTGLARTMLETFLPGVLGSPWSTKVAVTGQQLPPPAGWVLIVAYSATGLIIAASVLLKRSRAVLAWLLPAGYLAVSVALLAFARPSELAESIGRDMRYVTDLVPVAALSGGLAFLSPLVGDGTGTTAVTRRAPGSHRAPVPDSWRRGLLPAGALTVAVALAVAALVTDAANSRQIQHRQARQYVQTAQAQLSTAQDTVALYDSTVPEDVLIGVFGDDDRVSRVLGPLNLAATFDRPGVDLQMLNERGVPRPITLLDAASSVPGPVPNCGFPVIASPARIPMTALPGGRLVVRVDYFAHNDVDGVLIAAGEEHDVHFVAGLHRLFVAAEAPVPEVVLRLATGSADTVCVDGVKVARPLPEG